MKRDTPYRQLHSDFLPSYALVDHILHPIANPLVTVYKAVCKRSGETVVLKSYQLSAICELYQHQIFREVGLHASLTHEHVVALRAAFQVWQQASATTSWPTRVVCGLCTWVGASMCDLVMHTHSMPNFEHFPFLVNSLDAGG